MLQPKKTGGLFNNGKTVANTILDALDSKRKTKLLSQEEMMEKTSKKVKEVWNKGAELGQLSKKKTALKNAKDFTANKQK